MATNLDSPNFSSVGTVSTFFYHDPLESGPACHAVKKLFLPMSLGLAAIYVIVPTAAAQREESLLLIIWKASRRLHG